MSKSAIKKRDIGTPTKVESLKNFVNASKILNTAIASGNDIDTFNKAHKKAMKDMIAECPYCNPTWNDVPNFPEAMKGYDVPMGNPDPGITSLNMDTILKCGRITHFT